ncbi:MAG TPA: ATP-binding cassette domain-containing protein [Acidimicrobiia bacterium]|nr:ATP-binding cassette domain-containing protein [Acidimicrobiia bacterium]
MAAIDFDNVRVSYRTRKGTVSALSGLDLHVPEGGVFGFLGANGAGKTTAIRAAVGLLRGARGSIKVLGADAPRHLSRVIDNIGALVEQPSFFPNFSGRKNLSLLGTTIGVGRRRVDEVLDQVGLGARADSRFATYSLGMKQRLGVAAVLLKDPALLILDERANGLDPPGILEIRTLMRDLGAQGRTVFVSSHLLSEVEHTCDRVAIIAKGKCVAEGRVADLLRGSTSQFKLVVAGDAAGRAQQLLHTAGFAVQPNHEGMVVDVGPDRSHEVTRLLAQQGLYVAELSPISRSLEDVFLEITEDQA